MNFARALIRELVDKRLWPVAAVLVVALVAVPVVLSRGGESAAAEEGSPVHHQLLRGSTAQAGRARAKAACTTHYAARTPRSCP
ncbi:MAG: hypothetical protein ACRDLN_07900, partial [Solirubrobacteraceae bacterium]